MNIAPLARNQILTMIGEISERYALSRETAENLAERTGGVPLFVEEVMQLLRERGGHDVRGPARRHGLLLGGQSASQLG